MKHLKLICCTFLLCLSLRNAPANGFEKSTEENYLHGDFLGYVSSKKECAELATKKDYESFHVEKDQE